VRNGQAKLRRKRPNGGETKVGSLDAGGRLGDCPPFRKAILPGRSDAAGPGAAAECRIEPYHDVAESQHDRSSVSGNFSAMMHIAQAIRRAA
jgi:hypothetical protein